MDRSDIYMWCNKNKIEVKWVWFYGVSKYIDRFVVKLKAIKYNKDFSNYLSFYFPDFGFQVLYFLTLFF